MIMRSRGGRMMMTLILRFFLSIPASVADAAAVNPRGTKMLSANGLTTIFINGKPVFSNGPSNLSRNPLDCIIEFLII